MKKAVLLIAAILLTSTSILAAEPLLLEPLSPTVLSTMPAVSNTEQTETPKIEPSGQKGVYEATYTPPSKMEGNMVPQNAAAEGKPVPEKREPRVRVQTKQRSQGNAYWNAGGKGTKSFF